MSEKYFKKLLYKFMDSNLSDEEQLLFNNYCENNYEKENWKEEILKLRGYIKSYGKSDFSEGFEVRLLSKSNNYFLNNTKYVNVPDVITAVFRKVCISAAVILFIMSLYNVNAGNYNLFKNIFRKTLPNIEYVFEPTTKTILVNSK